MLRGLTLDIDAGERVALVGPSGAGKSTVVALALKFLPARSGSVQIVGAAGGVDLADLDGDDLRRVVGAVARRTPTSSTPQWVRTCASRVPRRTTTGYGRRCAGPACSTGSIGCRTAWDTHVGEHGAKVSAGQRQRIALARTFLADFPVLVLDEPTGSTSTSRRPWP